MSTERRQIPWQRLRTLKEIWLEVNLENVTRETLDRVVEWEDVDALAVLDVQAGVYVHNIAELHAQIVTGDLIHLDLALLNGIRAQANEHGVMPPLPTTQELAKWDIA